MIRLVMNVDKLATRHDFYADAPVDISVVRRHLDDWLEKPEVAVGVQHVRAQLRDDLVGHRNDTHHLGGGYGPRRLPTRAGLSAVSELVSCPRVVVTIDRQGCWGFHTDTPIALFVVNDHVPGDRVYQPDVRVDAEAVRFLLRIRQTNPSRLRR